MPNVKDLSISFQQFICELLDFVGLNLEIWKIAKAYTLLLVQILGFRADCMTKLCTERLQREPC